MSNDEIENLREKRQSPEGNLDKNGKPLKFSKDIESDWGGQNDIPHYGLKEHASVDIDNGFILSTNMTPASHHESRYLPYCTVYSHHTDDPINKVFADKAYPAQLNFALRTRRDLTG
jgi:IS5 family transposase